MLTLLRVAEHAAGEQHGDPVLAGESTTAACTAQWLAGQHVSAIGTRQGYARWRTQNERHVAQGSGERAWDGRLYSRPCPIRFPAASTTGAPRRRHGARLCSCSRTT